MRTYYAQNREDLLIQSFFPDVTDGFYIDVGANDPVIDSVTKILYDAGWSGINIDPIKKHVDNLAQQRPRDTTLQIGLSNKPGKLTFTEYPEGDGLSTFDSSMQAFYTKGNHPFPTAKAKHYQVVVKTLAQIIDELAPKQVHFIKIDVEGYEYEVISGYKWDKVRPELICVEANHIHKDWRPILARHDYEAVFFDGINNYYLAKEALHRKDYFNYPDAVFAGNPVYFPALQEVEQRAEALRKELADRDNLIVSLREQQHNVRFLAKHLAIEVRQRINKRAAIDYGQTGLVYKGDAELQTRLQNPDAPKEALLAFVRNRDKRNIVYKKVGPRLLLRALFWKIIAGLVNGAIKIAKKVARR
ncbi:MAG TPA: FkbM family methyltransferase [Candidatus Saccharimonadales bacterium]|nr:FkbM family methyltransferase [Candidatus Saccharimonadales bacterium]